MNMSKLPGKTPIGQGSKGIVVGARLEKQLTVFAAALYHRSLQFVSKISPTEYSNGG